MLHIFDDAGPIHDLPRKRTCPCPCYGDLKFSPLPSRSQVKVCIYVLDEVDFM